MNKQLILDMLSAVNRREQNITQLYRSFKNTPSIFFLSNVHIELAKCSYPLQCLITDPAWTLIKKSKQKKHTEITARLFHVNETSQTFPCHLASLIG